MTGPCAASWTQLELPLTPTFDVADLPERVAAKIDVDSSTGCWLWIAGRSSGGYGRARYDKAEVCAHRLVWRLLVDPTVPLRPGRGAAWQLDHRCRVVACVNPAHLELVSSRENGIRGRNGVLGGHRSRFVGVDRQGNRWRAGLKVDGVRVHLGNFLTEHAAAVVYDAASFIAYGDATNHRLGLLDDTPSPPALEHARGRLDRAVARAAERGAS